MAGKKREPAHRTIIYGGVLGGLSCEDVNKMLRDVNERDLPESSYRSIRDHYVPYFKADLGRLGRVIYHPPTWWDLKAAASGSPPDAAPNDSPTEDE
jgi:hypothetical protein